jgi:hypothetical protein
VQVSENKQVDSQNGAVLDATFFTNQSPELLPNF